MGLTVNGQPVNESEVLDEMERMRPEHNQIFGNMDPVLREAQLYEWAQENVIERVLVRQEALNSAIEVPDYEVETMLRNLKRQQGGEKKFYKSLGISPEDEPVVKEDIRLQLQVERLIESVREQVDKPGEDEIEKYYEENKSSLATTEAVHVAQIVRKITEPGDEAITRQKLEEAQEKIEQGADFFEVARDYSSVKGDKIDLGYITQGTYSEALESVAFALQPGEVSDIFSTGANLHIIKVLDRKVTDSLDNVKDQVAQILHNERKKEAVEEYLDNLKDNATIKKH